jgi:hypothetical protein
MLEEADGILASVKGDIRVKWKILSPGKRRLSVIAPEGMTVELILKRKVTEYQGGSEIVIDVNL